MYMEARIEAPTADSPCKHMLRMRSTADHARPSSMSAIEEAACADTKLPVHDDEREVSELAPGTCSVAAERVVPAAEDGMKPCASATFWICDRYSSDSDGRRRAKA